MTVAEQYPARTDANGVTWYRPVLAESQTWGWTSQPEQADPSYNYPRLTRVGNQLILH